MAINHNKYAILDFETGGTTRCRQPISIGIVIIDPRKMCIADNGLFYSMIKPHTTDCEKYGLDPIEEKALQVNNLTMADLESAPTPKAVWNNVINFLKYHNHKGGKWEAPIFTGWNTSFDTEICDRLIYGNNHNRLIIKNKLPSKSSIKKMTHEELIAVFDSIEQVKEPYKFGGETVFRPFPVIDVGSMFFSATESFREPHKQSLTAACEYLGFKPVNAHNALVDCLWTAEIFVRFMKIQRLVTADTDYNTGGETVLEIEKVLEKFQNLSKN